MKKHITVEQMKEVKDTVLAEALNDNNFKGELETINTMYLYHHEKETIIKRMSRRITIGKMIEILKSKGVNWFEVGYPEIKETGETKVFVNITKDIGFWSDSLCDSLWEAVKYVLEVEDET